MEVFYTPHFKREAKRLPIRIRTVIDERLKQFKKDPFHACLQTHKLNGRLSGFWAFSINRKIRIIFEFEKSVRAIFHSIGDHSMYDERR